MPTTLTAPQTKSFTFSEIKTVDEDKGVFQGYLSCFHNTDSYKDIVEPGAFTKTINDARGRGGKYLFPLLWQHDTKEPIGGFLEMREDNHGLFVKGQIDLNTTLGQRAYSGLKMGYLDGLSIGYDTIKQKYAGEIRHLLEVRMWEGSIVTFPANPATRVNGVKSEETTPKARDFNTIVGERAPDEMVDELYDLMSALMTSVLENVHEPESQESCEKQLDLSLSQFQKAIHAWAVSAVKALQIGEDSSETESDEQKSMALAHYLLSARAMKWAVKHSVKEGRTLSTATRTRIGSVLDTIQHAVSNLQDLLSPVAAPESEDDEDDEEPDDTKGNEGPTEEMMEWLQSIRKAS